MWRDSIGRKNAAFCLDFRDGKGFLGAPRGGAPRQEGFPVAYPGFPA